MAVPANRDAPIAAELAFWGADGFRVSADFDWRASTDIWEIAVDTDEGALHLLDGGARLVIDETDRTPDHPGEYPDLYRQFAKLIASGRSDVDISPLVHVADAFMLGRHIPTEAFHE